MIISPTMSGRLRSLSQSEKDELNDLFEIIRDLVDLPFAANFVLSNKQNELKWFVDRFRRLNMRGTIIDEIKVEDS